jgi:O-antigen/teichoic acid export membrane protein
MTSPAITADPDRAPTTTLARRVLSGTLQLTISNAVVRLLPFFTIPILTRKLDQSTYGVAALANTVVSLVSVLALAGLDVSYARTYHNARAPHGEVVEHFCWRRALLFATVLSIAAGVAWWCLGDDASVSRTTVAGLIVAGILGSVASTMAQTRARLIGRYRLMAIAIAIAGVATSATSIAIAVWWRQDALALLIPMVLAFVLPVAMLGTPRASSLARPTLLTREEGRRLFHVGLAAVITAPMYWVMSSADRWFLQYYCGEDAVGVYSLAFNLATAGLMLNAAIMAVWLPEAAREFERDPSAARVALGTLAVRLTVLMALVWLAVSAAGGDTIRWLANERFHGAAEFVPYIALGVFFYGASQFALAGLILVRKFQLGALWWTIGGGVSIALNIVLVGRYGAIGAAIAQAASFAFVFVLIFVAGQAHFPIDIDLRRLLPAIATIAAAAGVMIRPWHQRAPLSILAKLPFGMAVAAFVIWIAAPDWGASALRGLRAWRSS